ncbi:MAG: hypothetical protein A2Y77_08550 [Planctomycetes bacterium RBG_13_62_9]|nr:MAG: hypothetical protein A2Y77_08550 [Planctomycetes bacterium RBG_13_62_9]
MAYEMHVIREDNYLHVMVTGDNTPEDVAAYLNEIRRLCVERQVPRVLIEENLAGPSFETVDIYDVVVTAASQGAAPAVRYIAFVDTNPQHDFAEMEFAETVAVNRGVNVRVFRDVPAATAWIREQ